MLKKNKFIVIIFILIALIGGIFIYNKANYMNDKEIDSLLLKVKLYTTIEYGDSNHNINIDLHKKDNQLEGNLYIPGNYQGQNYLYWDLKGDGNLKIKDLIFSHQNGQLLISNKKLSLCLDNKNVDLILNVIKTSKDISPLFIEIDETLGTIEDMNADLIHDTECYGQASFNDQSHYISIKGRGNSTWTDCIKKPYNITFTDSEYSNKQSVSMIDGIETKKWSLLANYMEPSLLRNKIGYDLANKLSIGLDSIYYDVWMNGEFLGNYLITPKNDYQAPKNGYVLEIDNTIDPEDPQFYLMDDGKEVETLRFTVKSNDANMKIDDIQNHMQKVWNIIRKYDSDEYMDYIDIDSWAKAYLLNELFKNYDVVYGSIFIHKDDLTKDSKLMAGPIWDLDYALGQLTPNEDLGINDDISFTGGYWYVSSLNLEEGKYSFFQELGKHKSFLEKVKKAYIENKELFNVLVKQVNVNVEQGYDSFLADFNKWGNDREYNHFYTEDYWDYGGYYPVNYQPTNSYDGYMENLKKYLEVRVEFFNDNINNIE